MKAYYKQRMNDLTETTQKLESSLSQEEKRELSKKIKNKSKITWCAKDWAIYMTVQKGKYYIYYGFLSEYYD